jgi:DME family drug/metabolite transporter
LAETSLLSKAQISTRSDLSGSLAVLFATACWGTSGVLVKFVMSSVEVTALALAFWRDLVTFLVLLIGVGLFWPAWLHVRRRDLRWLAAMGGSLGVLHVIWNLGVVLNGAAVTTMQQAAMPAIVAVVAWFVWREPLTWTKILAILFAFAGTVLVSGLDVLGQVSISPAGLLAGLGIPILYATWNLFSKKVRADYNPITTLTYAFGFGALVLLPFQFLTPQPWAVSPPAFFWFAALIVLATITPFSVYTFGLGRLPASVASILAMSEIAFSAFFAYLLLGERLSASQILGAALIVGGVLLLSWRRWRAVEK